MRVEVHLRVSKSYLCTSGKVLHTQLGLCVSKLYAAFSEKVYVCTYDDPRCNSRGRCYTYGVYHLSKKVERTIRVQ